MKKRTLKSMTAIISASAMTAMIATMFVGPASYASTQCVVDDFTDTAGSDSVGSRTIAFCIADVDSGGTITFDTSDPVTISLSSELDRAGDVVINGAGLVTLKVQEGLDERILDVDGGNITVIGLTFEGGKKSNNEGGAISAEGSVTVSNSVFRNNVADQGGAIYASAAVEIVGSTFSNNSAQREGGGVYSFKNDVEITNSEFEGNTAGSDGGGVYSVDGAHVINSEFDGNTTGNDGGAIYASDLLKIEGSVFTENSASDDGGAGYSTTNDVDISNSVLSKNAAGDKGGAIYADVDLRVTGSVFKENTAQNDGGAIYSFDDDVDITNSEFEGNNAGSDGGAAHADDDLRVTGSVFKENTANDEGGAVYADDDADITNSEFDSNTTGNDGGAIYVHDLLKIKSSVFTENSADDDGGAGYSNTNDIDISSSVLDKNTAGDNGGALFADDDIRVTTSSFTENQANNDGGALYADFEDVDIKQSYFGLNSAGDDGGVASVDEHIRVENSTFYQNTAADKGGVFANQGANTSDDGHILYSTFVENTAAEASILFWDNADMKLFGNVLLDNSTPVLISAEGSASTFTDLGANATSGADALFDHPSSRAGVSPSAVQLNEPGEPTIDSIPEIRFGSPESLGTSVDEELALAADESINLPVTDQSGSLRSFARAPLSKGEIIDFNIPSFAGFDGMEIDLNISKAGQVYNLLSGNMAFYVFNEWGEVRVSTDNWSSSESLDVSSSDQCQLEVNSTDVSLELYYGYTRSNSLPVNNVVMSCDIEPVTLGGGDVAFTVVREFKGSFFSTKVLASEVSGNPAPFNIAIGGGLNTSKDTKLDNGKSSDWNYVVTEPNPSDDFNDAVVGYRSTSEFSFDSNPGTPFASPGSTSFLTLNSQVTATSTSSEIFETQVWTVNYDSGQSSTAQSFASTVADAEFGCPIATVENAFPTENCQPMDSPVEIPSNLRADAEFKEFFPGATLTRGERIPSGFASAPAPYSGPVVTGAQLVENQLMLEGDRLDLISSITLGETELDVSGEKNRYADVSELPEGEYRLVYNHQSGSVETSIEVQITKPNPEAEFWTKQISASEINFYAKNIVGAGKVQFFHNGNEVAWVRAEDDDSSKLRVISEGPMAGANYLVRTREMIEGKNVFEIYVDGERVLRRAQGG